MPNIIIGFAIKEKTYLCYFAAVSKFENLLSAVITEWKSIQNANSTKDFLDWILAPLDENKPLKKRSSFYLRGHEMLPWISHIGRDYDDTRFLVWNDENMTWLYQFILIFDLNVCKTRFYRNSLQNNRYDVQQEVVEYCNSELNPVFWDKRDEEISWKLTVFKLLATVCQSLYFLELPPYILLEIFDHLPLMAKYVDAKRKINCIYRLNHIFEKIKTK